MVWYIRQGVSLGEVESSSGAGKHVGAVTGSRSLAFFCVHLEDLIILLREAESIHRKLASANGAALRGCDKGNIRAAAVRVGEHDCLPLYGIKSGSTQRTYDD